MKKPRKWPVRATKDELIAIIKSEIHKRSKIEGGMPTLFRLPIEEITLLAIAFGYRDPEAREREERRAGWERENRERREANNVKALPAPPLRIAGPSDE